jgi:hypothetical protein
MDLIKSHIFFVLLSTRVRRSDRGISQQVVGAAGAEMDNSEFGAALKCAEFFLFLGRFCIKLLKDVSPKWGCRLHYTAFDFQQEKLHGDNGKRGSIFPSAFDPRSEKS